MRLVTCDSILGDFVPLDEYIPAFDFVVYQASTLIDIQFKYQLHQNIPLWLQLFQVILIP